MNLEEAKLKLSKYGQEQILRYFDELSDDEKAALLEQIDKTDMEVLSAIEHKSELVKKGEITPLDAMELDEIKADYDTFKNTGVEAIKAGKVGAILLAGGMGTRLGSDNPKGMYNVGVNRELYIFECLINNLMDVVKETGTYIHLFVMTSEKNNDRALHHPHAQQNIVDAGSCGAAIAAQQLQRCALPHHGHAVGEGAVHVENPLLAVHLSSS